MQDSVLAQIFLVVPARQGWAVSLGADTIQVFASRQAARDAAMTLAASALASGERAGWMDPDLADETPEARSNAGADDERGA